MTSETKIYRGGDTKADAVLKVVNPLTFTPYTDIHAVMII